MNNKLLVKLSNTIGIFSIILLVYWVFVFISVTVFGFKVFKETLTETFYLSIIGILALMVGALIINVMFNLTRIAEKHNQDTSTLSKKATHKLGLLFAVSFPIVFGLLYGGDYLTSKKKEMMLVASAKSIIESNSAKSKQMVNYTFDKKWIKSTGDILEIFSKTDLNFPNTSVIVADSLGESQSFLGFGDYMDKINDTIPLKKKDFIRQTTQDQREYLTNVFFGNFEGVKFSAKKGSYELFYPYFKDGKKIVLYFSDYQHYGKIGR